MSYDPDKYLLNRERILAYHARYRDENREKERLRHKKYKQLNKEKHAAHERQRRARKRNAPSEPYTITDVLERYGTNCHICGLKINLKAQRRPGRKGWEKGLHIDHLLEISKGGADTLDNVRPSHGLCNLQRNGKYKDLIVI